MAKSVGKNWWKSKTLWFNFVVLVIGVVEVVTQVYVIPPDVLVLVDGVGNVLLRFLTTDPIV